MGGGDLELMDAGKGVCRWSQNSSREGKTSKLQTLASIFTETLKNVSNASRWAGVLNTGEFPEGTCQDVPALQTDRPHENNARQ